MVRNRTARPYNLGVRAIVDEATRDEWARRLRTTRVRQGMTQAALAAAIGSTRQSVSAWERGVAVPRAEVRAVIARALGRQVRTLFPATVAA